MNFLKEALSYCKRGYSVIPIKPTGKKPLVEWTEYQTRIATEKKMKKWWKKWPDTNVGIVTGNISGLVVIDCDSKGAVKRFMKDYPEAGITRQVETGNGRHFYFRSETGIRNDVGSLLGPGIDIRAEGGFVVAPPSVHPNGKTYRWLNRKKPVPLPAKLRERLLKRTRNSDSKAPEGSDRERFNTSRALAGVAEGERDHTLFGLACKLRNADVPQDYAKNLILEAANNCQPPFPDEEALEKVQRAYEQYEPKQDSIFPNSSPYTAAESENSESPIIWAKDVPPPGKGEEIQCLLEPFLFPSSLHLLAGDAGIGKTTFLYNLAIHLARGKEFAGSTPPRALRILYCDLETPEVLFKRKLHLISENSPPEGLAFIRSFKPERVLTLIKRHQFDLVILDTLNEAFETREEEDNAEANRQMRQLRRIIMDTKVAILGVSHMGKDPSSKSVYKLRGASARPAAADIVVNVEPYSEDIICIEVVKNRWVGGKAKVFLRKAGEDTFEVTEVSGVETATTEKQIQDFIESIIPYEPKTIRTRKIISKAKKEDFQISTAEKVLSRMAQVGLHGIKREKYGYYTKIHPEDSHINK